MAGTWLVQRKLVPSTHMRWRMTPSLRARATRAFFAPRRLATPMAQLLSGDIRTVRVSITLAERRATILSHREKSWASITFAGTRHTLELEFVSAEAVAAGERFIVFLPEHEFGLPGQLVADAAVVSVDHRLLPEPRMAVGIELLLLDKG